MKAQNALSVRRITPHPRIEVSNNQKLVIGWSISDDLVQLLVELLLDEVISCERWALTKCCASPQLYPQHQKSLSLGHHF